MIRRVGVAVSITVAASALAVAAALPSFATPKDDPPPQSGDPRATAYAGNANSCADAKLDGEIILQKEYQGEGPTSVDIDPEDIPDGFEVTGVVVKGANAFNVYVPPAYDDLVAPLKNGKHPGISHWFVCGVEDDTTTTTTTTTTSTSTSTSSSTQPGGGDSSTTTTAPAAQGSAGAAGGGDLAATGASGVTPLLVAGGALVLIGGGLLFLLRRTRGQRG